MKGLQSIIRAFLLSITLFAAGGMLKAQDNTRISFQVAPLYSYLKADLAKYNNYTYEGIDHPRTGFASAVKFEADINSRFALSTGLSYEIRKNSYLVNLYDTTAFPSPAGIVPYRLTSHGTYYFVGIPVALQVNYLNTPQWRIYQSFGTQFSFLVSSRFKGVGYWEEKSNLPYSKSGSSDDKNNVVVSVSSSIAICKNITPRMAFKLEPGIQYMANNFWDNDFGREKFMDLKVEAGIVYQLTKKDQ